MSVADPVIDHLDPETKRIYLLAGCRSYHPVDDIYEEIRYLRRTNENLRNYQVMVTAAGNVPKGGGKFTPRYAVFQNGWRVVPEDVTHVLNVNGEQLTAEGGAGPACFDLEPISATSKLIIQYEPPAAEVILGDGGAPGDAPTVAEIDARLSLTHGAGNWEGGGAAPTVEQIKAGILGAAVPASYGTDTLGGRVGNNLNATISSRAVPGSAMDLVTDSIDDAAFSAAAVTKVQAGLATASALSTAQGDLTNIKTRLPAALISGRIDARVGSVAPGVITAAEAPSLSNLDAAVSSRSVPGAEMALTSPTITAVKSGLATSSEVTTVSNKLPAALVGGRMDSRVGAVAPGVITSTEAPALSNLDALVSSRAVPGSQMALTVNERTEVSNAVNTKLSAVHGSGSWDTVTPLDPRIDGIVSTLATMAPQLLTIFKVETNRWRIVNNQMIFYDDDGTTPLITFNLKDIVGDPTMLSAYDRVPVR